MCVRVHGYACVCVKIMLQCNEHSYVCHLMKMCRPFFSFPCKACVSSDHVFLKRGEPPQRALFCQLRKMKYCGLHFPYTISSMKLILKVN